MGLTQQGGDVADSGAMEAQIRAFDWAATELGPRSSWPAALLTIVESMLSNPWPVLLWLGEHEIQLYNDAARRKLLGDRHPRALGTPAAGTWGGAWPRLEAAVGRVRSHRTAMVIADVALDHGDEACSWSLAISPLPHGTHPPGGVIVRVRATTALELAVERTARCEAERECERWRAVFAQAPAAIAVLRGPHHVVELANDPMTSAWGYPPGATIGQALCDAVPEARPFVPLLDEVRRTGRPYLGQEVTFRTEATVDNKRVEHFANFVLAPLRDRDETITGVIVIAVDMTEEVSHRREVERLRASAESANRAKDEFMAILGHELRNPLSPIATALQVMRMRGVQGRELDVIERQVSHLARLVDDLLDVSRAIRGRIELRRRDLELAEVVSEAIEVSSPLLEERRDALEIDVPRHGLAISADPSRLAQAISNLITNAAKYSDPGSPITIRGVRAGPRIRLSVRDRGIGIAPEMLDRVFDLFVQGSQALDRSRGGLGLGLAIVRSLVELHGGSVSAASEGLGRGSEFTIELPALDHASAPPKPAAEAGPAAPVATQDVRILVVDDNEDAATILGAALEHLGYRVAVAHDGPSALRIAEPFAPHIALLDLGLPVMDGYELARRLRAARGPDLHLVAITGYGQEADRQSTARAGFEHHLVKPVDLSMLSDIVARLAGAARGSSPEP